ncbi:hypothetical protein C3L33_17414, partial [Rhododendron williamsianum]
MVRRRLSTKLARRTPRLQRREAVKIEAAVEGDGGWRFNVEDNVRDKGEGFHPLVGYIQKSFSKEWKAWFPSHLRMRPLSTSSVFCNDLVNRLSSLLGILLLGEQGIDI